MRQELFLSLSAAIVVGTAYLTTRIKVSPETKAAHPNYHFPEPGDFLLPVLS
jgi:hypothetical protein